MSDSAAAVLTALSHQERILMITHATPDGDSAGSALALGLALEREGRTVEWVSWDGVPERLRFLPASDRVKEWAAVDWGTFNAAVAVDCGHQSRLAAPEDFWTKGPTLINIDHHPGNPLFGSVNWVDDQASSTGELVVELFRRAGWVPTRDEALCLYTAISTDTLSFRQVNATLKTLEAVHWLISAAQLDMAWANRLVWDSRPEGEVRFLGWALGSVEMSADGRLAWIAVPRAAMVRYGVDDSGVDTVVHHLLSIAGVDIAFLVREGDQPDRVKVSWRAKSPYDVGTVAQTFGGGGHRYAAAAQLESTLEEAVEAVKKSLGAVPRV
jgi:phosphoesterase RecJ-like protein